MFYGRIRTFPFGSPFCFSPWLCSASNFFLCYSPCESPNWRVVLHGSNLFNAEWLQFLCFFFVFIPPPPFFLPSLELGFSPKLSSSAIKAPIAYRLQPDFRTFWFYVCNSVLSFSPLVTNIPVILLQFFGCFGVLENFYPIQFSSDILIVTHLAVRSSAPPRRLRPLVA